MCGIAGQLSVDGSDRALATVGRIIASQHSRGPDNTAVEEISVMGGSLVLGHNRLSIIDLSAAANQPIWDADRLVCTVFNGEMYNYIEVREELRQTGAVFRTDSDTEVLLEAYKLWGADCLDKFVGMFAFALFDSRSNTLHLARDRFGVKPLYVLRRPGSVTWGSSGKVIAQEFGLGPNLEYLYKGVSTWNFDDDTSACQYEGLEMVRPGHWMACAIEGGQVRTSDSQWYDLACKAGSLREALAGASEKALAERVLETFDSACEYRLRSDVPVAVALSGGLDSGAVACTVGPLREAMRAFTFGDPLDAATEAPIAQMLAEKAGIGITFVRPDPAEVMAAFEPTLSAQDAPFVSVSQVAQYMVAREVRASGFKALLGGQGGDEAFMGYRKYFAFVLKEHLGSKRYVEASALAAQIPRLMLSERGQLGNYWRHRKRFTGSVVESALRWPDGLKAPEISFDGKSAWRRQMLDVTRFSLPTLLRYEDRNSMAHSIETRLPFLDQRVIELGLALPERLKVRHGFGKHVLRQAMAGRVPDSVRLARYKLGFPVDQKKVVEEGLGALVRQLVQESPPDVRALIKPGLGVDEAFSDSRLSTDIRAMPEALALVWMGRRL